MTETKKVSKTKKVKEQKAVEKAGATSVPLYPIESAAYKAAILRGEVKEESSG